MIKILLTLFGPMNSATKDKGAAQEPIFVLQHGNKKVDTKRLAAAAGVKRDHVKPTKPERATAFTGYVFGGTTVFGSNTQLKTYVETSIFNLETVYVNGGSTSLCLSMSSADFERALGCLVAWNHRWPPDFCYIGVYDLCGTLLGGTGYL